MALEGNGKNGEVCVCAGLGLGAVLRRRLFCFWVEIQKDYDGGWDGDGCVSIIHTDEERLAWADEAMMANVAVSGNLIR